MKSLLFSTIVVLLVCLPVHSQIESDFPKVPFDRYQLHDEMTETLEKWHELYPSLTKLYSIGESVLGKKLWVLEVTNFETGPGEDKPGFWADGGTHPDEPCGTPMVMHNAQVLLLGFGKDPFLTELLNTRVFYILPKINPDGTDYYLTEPGMISHAMPWDSDRDGLVDEDPPEDLNSDGAITVMRVRDESGPLKTSELDSRLLTTRNETEKGEFRTYTEGIDNDNDGLFNEDDIGGINVNRNYPYEWSPSQRGAGTHPLSVPESRAVIEFFATHPNITGSYSIHGGGWPISWNIRPPANVPDELVPEFDLDTFRLIGNKYTEITGGGLVEGLYYDTIMKSKPGPYGYGLFTMWAYHDYGIYAFTPEIAGIDADYDGDGSISEMETLKWNDDVKGGKYYIDWKPFEHPQLGPVEIGGWVKKIAPIDTGLEKVCKEHTEFNLYHASLSPLLKISSLNETAVSKGIYKIEATVSNFGFLPTYISKMAVMNNRDYPIVVSLKLDNGSIVTGKSRNVIGHLEGNAPQSPGYFLFSGGSKQLPSKKMEWVVQKSAGGSLKVSVSASCAKGGRDERTLELK
jgi:hypothetical protein